MDNKLKESLELQQKLQANQSRYDTQIKAAKETLGAVSVKHQLGLLSRTSIGAARDKLDRLTATRDEEALQLAALPGIIAELKGQSGTANARGGSDRRERIAQAQKDYQRLWSKLNIRANSTGERIVTPEVRQAFEELLEAGRILRNTAKIASLVETWGLMPERNTYGECIGIADSDGGQRYGDWNPPAPAKPPPWTAPVFASYSKRLKISEKHLLQLFIGYQKSRTDNVVTGWTSQTRDEFNRFQDHLEDTDAIPEPDFKPPSQDDLCAELNMSEKSLRNRFKSFKAENGIPNSYRHLTSKNYQAFRVFLDGTPVAKYGGGVQRQLPD